MKSPHPAHGLTDRVWNDCNKILLAVINQFIDLNIIGWEHVICNQCNKNADYECGPDCPVALAVKLRDLLS